MSRAHNLTAFFAVLLALCFVTTNAFAQDDDRPTALDSGTHTLAFAFPVGGASNWSENIGATGTTGIGYFYGLDRQFQLGLIAGMMLGDDFFFEANPTAKFFLSTTEQVVPYLYGHVDLAHDSNDFFFGLGGGIGGEFFIVPQFSLGGRAGVVLIDSTGGDVATIVSGLDINFHF